MASIVGCTLGRVPPAMEHRPGAVDRISKAPEERARYPLQPEGEFGDDTEIAAAAQRPGRVGVLVVTGPAVRRISHPLGFAIYLASKDGYEDSILPTGDSAGSPEDAWTPPAVSTLATPPTELRIRPGR